MAVNFATIFSTPEEDGSALPVIQTEVATLDFVYEYVEHLKSSFIKVDDSARRGRWNWEYMITKVLAEQISRYSRLRCVNNAKIFKGPLVYLFEVTTISELYSNFDTPIEDTVLIKISETNSEEVLFDGVLSSYTRPEED